MSYVRFKCPHCGQMFEGAREDAGSEAECPSCGKAFKLEPLTEIEVKSRPVAIFWYFGCFRKYVGFRGRARRREFWWAFLFQFVAIFVIGFIDAIIWDEYDEQRYLLVGLFLLATLLPIMAVHVRRLHDTNKSAWWVLLLPLPVLNIAYFVWLATDGDKGRNRFGPDPKGRE